MDPGPLLESARLLELTRMTYLSSVNHFAPVFQGKLVLALDSESNPS